MPIYHRFTDKERNFRDPIVTTNPDVVTRRSRGVLTYRCGAANRRFGPMQTFVIFH
jgi:hypothetical protein